MPWYNGCSQAAFEGHTLLTGDFPGCELRWSLIALRKIKLFSHSYQVRERVSAHLLHNPAAVHFNRDFTRTQFRRDLLVEPAGDDELHNFALAGRQGLIPVPQLLCQPLLS